VLYCENVKKCVVYHITYLTISFQHLDFLCFQAIIIIIINHSIERNSHLLVTYHGAKE